MTASRCSRSTGSRPATATRSCCTASSLRAERDEVVAIIGPNGAGKSTLLKAVYGLVTRARRAACACGRRDRRRAPRPADAPRAQLRPADSTTSSRACRSPRTCTSARSRCRARSALRRSSAYTTLFPLLARAAAAARRARSPAASASWSRSPARSSRGPRLLLLDEPSAGPRPPGRWSSFSTSSPRSTRWVSGS